MLLVLYGGIVVFKFELHKLEDGRVVTRAMKSAPPVPVLAALLDEAGTVFGFVARVVPDKMERWVLEFCSTEREARLVSRGATLPDEVLPVILTTTHGINMLQGILTERVWETLEGFAMTVEALADAADETLLDIDGVGPASLLAIRNACHQVLENDGD